MKSNPGISYIVPAYNEEDSIGDTLKRLHCVLSTLTIPFEIIVVNDGSSDRTAEIAGQSSLVTLINHPMNIGYGNSLKTGIRRAEYDWIGIVDADSSYPIEDIQNLVREMNNGFDMVVGSRENTVKLDKPIKKLFRWMFKKIIKLVVKNNIEDPNSGFRMFKRELAMNFLPFLCGTFSFTTSLTILSIGQSYFVKYIPIKYCPREGISKVRHFRDSILTIQYIIQGMTFFNPIKFFMILTFVMVLIVYIPAMICAMFRMLTLSLYYVCFGTTVTLLIALGVLADTVRISIMKNTEYITEK